MADKETQLVDKAILRAVLGVVIENANKPVTLVMTAEEIASLVRSREATYDNTR